MNLSAPKITPFGNVQGKNEVLNKVMDIEVGYNVSKTFNTKYTLYLNTTRWWILTNKGTSLAW